MADRLCRPTLRACKRSAPSRQWCSSLHAGAERSLRSAAPDSLRSRGSKKNPGRRSRTRSAPAWRSCGGSG